MKKFLALALASVMAVSLVACGRNQADTKAQPEPMQNPVRQLPPLQQLQQLQQLQRAAVKNPV